MFDEAAADDKKDEQQELDPKAMEAFLRAQRSHAAYAAAAGTKRKQPQDDRPAEEVQRQREEGRTVFGYGF